MACRNFLKLCALKFFNGQLFFNVQSDYVAQTGDPTGTGNGGSSVYGLLGGGRYFEPELRPTLKHSDAGTVSMPLPCGSQWLVTTRSDITSLDGHAVPFGRVVEGLDSTVMAINGAYCDDNGRPYQDIRIRHTYVLVDPFPHPPGLAALLPPTGSGSGGGGDVSPARARPAEEAVPERLSAEEAVAALAPEEESALAEQMAEREARSRAVVLEMVGDLPDADVRPPDTVLFVCKLNPVTSEDDLSLLFSRFGDVRAANIIRDAKTGDSLCYGFIEFDTPSAAEAAYMKMNNVLVDDRRIKVDFSQFVAHLWARYKKGGKRQARDAEGMAAGQGRSFGRGGGRGGFGGGSSNRGGLHAPGRPQQQQQQQAQSSSHINSFNASQVPSGGVKRSRWGPDMPLAAASSVPAPMPQSSLPAAAGSSSSSSAGRGGGVAAASVSAPADRSSGRDHSDNDRRRSRSNSASSSGSSGRSRSPGDGERRHHKRRRHHHHHSSSNEGNRDGHGRHRHHRHRSGSSSRGRGEQRDSHREERMSANRGRGDSSAAERERDDGVRPGAARRSSDDDGFNRGRGDRDSARHARGSSPPPPPQARRPADVSSSSNNNTSGGRRFDERDRRRSRSRSRSGSHNRDGDGARRGAHDSSSSRRTNDSDRDYHRRDRHAQDRDRDRGGLRGRSRSASPRDRAHGDKQASSQRDGYGR